MKLSVFQQYVKAFYAAHARVLPWRSHPTPYNVFVSEVMLQQTQVPRVVEKFNEFVALFPNFQALAQAPTDALLKAWSGLGYNRRALNLRKAAQLIIEKYQGTLPNSLEALDALPGIGPATAASIAAFAFNKPVVFIETNIRSVFIHHFFPKQTNIPDTQLLPLVAQTLDKKHPKKWYSALMDYGSFLKKQTANPSRKSKHYAKQSTFEGSDRQLRGRIIKLLLQKPATYHALTKELDNDARITPLLMQLQEEGFIVQQGTTFRVK